MKPIKKILALVIAMVMVLTTLGAFTAFADAGDATSDDTISVTDLAVGDSVKYYQVLKWVDGSGWKLGDGFTSLVGTDLGATEDAVVEAIIAGISQDQANLIASKAASASPVSATADVLTSTTWSKSNPEAGLYMVIVAAKDAGVIYNPAFVGADFVSNNSNTVSITDTYENNGIAKKETTTVSKTTSDANEEKQEAINSYVGQEVTFYVNTTIPVFLDSYQNPSFVIKDAIKTAGIALNADSIKVKLGATSSQTVYGKEADEENHILAYNEEIFKVDPATATGYTVTFEKDYLGNLSAAVPVEIEYTGTITNTAEFNVNEDNNTVDIEYSNGPGTEKAALRDRTNHYTFSIGAKAFGETGANGKTYELIKVAVDKDGKPVVEKKKVSEWEDEPERHPLEGATFGLYTAADCAETSRYKFGKYSNATDYPNGAEFTTGEDGIINFEGLAAGQYYIKELDAPDGYVKDTKIVSVLIEATYKSVTVDDTVEDGIAIKGYTTKVLDKYTVTVNNVDVYTAGAEGADGTYGASSAAVVSTYEFNNDGPTISEIKESTDVKDGDIPNTVGTELPSTGGMGTTLFYIIGAILVLGAGILLVTRRRMNAN